MKLLKYLDDNAYPMIDVGDEKKISLDDFDNLIDWDNLINNLKVNIPDISWLSKDHLRTYAGSLVLMIILNLKTEQFLTLLKKDTAQSEGYKLFIRALLDIQKIRPQILHRIEKEVKKSKDLEYEFKIDGNLLKEKEENMHGIDNTNLWEALI